MTRDVIIIGGGPAGYTAALYAARADLKPLVIEGFAWGGLLQQTTDVENFPGFPDGILGPDLMTNMRAQAERFGAEFVTDNATSVEFGEFPGSIHKVHTYDQVYEARSLILSTGADHVRLRVPGEAEFSGKSVSYCATCDGIFAKGQEVVVVGGGDSAMEEALFLAKFASKVTIVHRRDVFRASKIMFERVMADPNIEILTPFEVLEIGAKKEHVHKRLDFVRLRNSQTGEKHDFDTDFVFIAIGHHPVSELFVDKVNLDEEGYVKTIPGSTSVGHPGVFACGDLVDHKYRQAITAAGSGCQAALDAGWYLRDNPPATP